MAPPPGWTWQDEEGEKNPPPKKQLSADELAEARDGESNEPKEKEPPK